LLPFSVGRLRRPALTIWAIALCTGWWRRITYVRAAPPAVQLVFPPRRWPLILLYTFVDFATWARAAVEAFVPAWRGRW